MSARGIVLLFGPWNFPFTLIFRPLVVMVAAGNCALVKPNEMAPNTSKVAAEIIRDVFDEQEVAVFEGGVELANRLLEQPINHVFFTGKPSGGEKSNGRCSASPSLCDFGAGGQKSPLLLTALPMCAMRLIK